MTTTGFTLLILPVFLAYHLTSQNNLYLIQNWDFIP